jgi:Fe2+ or Zn2+ uptake regulation protein
MPGHDELRTTLRAHGLRVTPQRLAIQTALRALGRHATAEEVLARVHGTVPGVSLPTVYAGLELLADLGLASRVHAGRAVRFDPRADPHHHFVCDDCGAVSDLDAAVDLAPALERLRGAGAEPAGAEVLVRGRCAACAAALKTATAH